VSGSNPTYPIGQCTRYVADAWSCPVGPYWGNAAQWLDSARSAGYVISPAPAPGAVAVWRANVGGALEAGHVALVTALEPLTVAGADWPLGAGPRGYVVGAAGAPGPPSGYILPVLVEDVMMTPAERLDVARALTRLAYAAAGHRPPETQAAEDGWAGPDLAAVQSFDLMVRDVLATPEMSGDMAKDAARDAVKEGA
jgi:hypothetical protein